MRFLLAGLLLFAAPAEPPRVRAVIKPSAERTAAPAFRLANGSSRLQSLSSYRGKIVLLDFWATECGGCKVEIPWFMEFARQYKSGGLEVVGISEDIPYEGLKDASEGWSRVKPFIETSLPVTYLIDRQGRIAAEYVGLVDKDDVERNVRVLLKERAY
jgi:peroxiredoxin